MNTFADRARQPRRTLGALALLVAACGGGGDPADLSTAQAEPEAVASATLFDDDGGVMPSVPDALPVDPAVHTRAGRYATHAQARDLRRALGADGVWELTASMHDVATAAQAQAALQGSVPTAILVRGPDLRLAAALVDELDALGVAPVWLVTQ